MATDDLHCWVLKRPGDKSSNDLRSVAIPLMRFQNAVSNLDEPAFRAAFEAYDADQNPRIPANAEPQVPASIGRLCLLQRCQEMALAIFIV